MFFRYNWPSIIWALIIGLLTLMPGKSMPKLDLWDFSNIDKIAHFFVFSILSFLVMMGFKKQRNFSVLREKTVRYTIGYTISYGCIIEFIQSFIPDRSLELNDMTANAIGCLLGIGLYKIIFMMKK